MKLLPAAFYDYLYTIIIWKYSTAHRNPNLRRLLGLASQRQVTRLCLCRLFVAATCQRARVRGARLPPETA